MRKAFVLLLLVGWVGAMLAEQPSKLPQPTSYVSDFAGVIDAGSKANIEALCTQLHEKAKATVEVVTIKSLEGDTIEDFATQLEDKWKVGAKGTDKGVILLFAMQERKGRIEVGYGLEGVLNDAKVGDILRSIKPQWDQGSIGPAIESATQQVAADVAQDAGVTLDAQPQAVHTYHTQPAQNNLKTSRVVFIVILVVVFLIIGRGGRGGGGGGGWMWFLLGNMMGGGRGSGFGGFGGGGGGGGGDDFGGGFGGGSGGGGASGDL